MFSNDCVWPNAYRLRYSKLDIGLSSPGGFRLGSPVSFVATLLVSVARPLFAIAGHEAEA